MEINKNAVDYLIRKYELVRYENIRQEIRSIKEILENIHGKDEELTNKYDQLLSKLELELRLLEHNDRNRDEYSEDEMEI